MIPAPKPAPRVKTPKPLRRSAPLARTRMPIARGKRIKKSNAYMHPEWRKLVRLVRKRSRGWCEACDAAPVEGDPHHMAYQAGRVGWQRLIVPLDQLLDCCRRCHLGFHANTSQRGGAG